jgi:hypothetical protein
MFSPDTATLLAKIYVLYVELLKLDEEDIPVDMHMIIKTAG